MKYRCMRSTPHEIYYSIYSSTTSNTPLSVLHPLVTNSDQFYVNMDELKLNFAPQTMGRKKLFAPALLSFHF